MLNIFQCSSALWQRKLHQHYLLLNLFLFELKINRSFCWNWRWFIFFIYFCCYLQNRFFPFVFVEQKCQEMVASFSWLKCFVDLCIYFIYTHIDIDLKLFVSKSPSLSHAHLIEMFDQIHIESIIFDGIINKIPTANNINDDDDDNNNINNECKQCDCPNTAVFLIDRL